MTRPTISVITPAHPARAANGKLSRACGSVWTQSLKPDAHIVAMDNDREGAAATRQRALMQARTDWVAFLDSDDVFLPKHLEWLMAHALEQGSDYAYAWFKVMQEFPNGQQRILEDDPVFPVTHYTNDFDPENPIETTITVLVRTGLAQSVGFAKLDRGEENGGEDYGFLLGCLKLGAKVTHLKRKSWLWSHSQLANGTPANTGGLPTRGDAALI